MGAARVVRGGGAAAGVVLMLALGACSAAPSPTPAPSAGAVDIPVDRRGEALQVDGTTLEGEPFSLAAQRGRVVVVNSWGAWCIPCRAEVKELEAAYADLKPQGVQFVGLNQDDSASTARDFQRDFGMTYPSLRKDPQALLGFRGAIPVKTVPATLVVDPQGRPAARILGQVTAAKVLAAVAQVRAGG